MISYLFFQYVPPTNLQKTRQPKRSIIKQQPLIEPVPWCRGQSYQLILCPTMSHQRKSLMPCHFSQKQSFSSLTLPCLYCFVLSIETGWEVSPQWLTTVIFKRVRWEYFVSNIRIQQLICNKMKRILLAILSLVYLSSATGADLRFHYCMGKFESWSLGHNEGRECGGCGMEKKASQRNGCCKDELKHVKLQVDQQSTNAPVYQLPVIERASILSFFTYSTWQDNKHTFSSNITGPPLRRRLIATYLRDRVFRIWYYTIPDASASFLAIAPLR